MPAKDRVLAAFPYARPHVRLTDGFTEIHRDGSYYAHLMSLGEGETENEAWAEAALTVANAPLAFAMITAGLIPPEQWNP